MVDAAEFVHCLSACISCCCDWFRRRHNPEAQESKII